MRTNISVTAEPRASRGKNEARRMRRGGKVPAVVYGAGQEPVSVAVNPRDIWKIVHSSTGYNTIFDLQLDGSDRVPVMVVDHQVHPVKGNLLHADLKRIDLSKRLRVTVPVHVQGEPKGVKVQGGLLELVTRSIEIECLPNDIPEHFTLDVGELLIGQSKRAGEIQVSGSIRLVSSPDSVIAHVVALRGEATAAPVEGAAPAPTEPEVAQKGKKEEESAPEEKGKKK